MGEQLGGASPPPIRYDLIDVQRAEARRRTLHHCRVDLSDLDVERGEPLATAWRSWPLWFGKFRALQKVTVFPHGRVDKHVAARQAGGGADRA